MKENLKEIILRQILNDIDLRIISIQGAIQDAKDSRDNETKSSVGDKYETGRTLMQQEVEKNRVQLAKTEILKNELLKIDVNKQYNSVEFGSLVITRGDKYFISAALGKMEVNNSIYYCISLASPLGKVLHQKKVNEEYTFRGVSHTILDIL